MNALEVANKINTLIQYDYQLTDVIVKNLQVKVTFSNVDNNGNLVESETYHVEKLENQDGLYNWYVINKSNACPDCVLQDLGFITHS